MTQPLTFSVRADLFRVAQAFTDARQARLAGVRIEPLAHGNGVVLIGSNGADLIAVVDRTGAANRPGTVNVGKAILNMAVDLFRRDGVEVRLKSAGGVAFIDPDTGGANATRNFEIQAPYPNWRAALSPHAICRLELPLSLNARVARRLSEAAIGLARAARSEDEHVIFKGGECALVATFPAWEEAVAIFEDTRRVDVNEDRSTLWHLPQWAALRTLAAAT